MKKNKIAAFESFTGGLFSAMITKIPGASKYFEGAIISYHNDIKEKFEIDTKKGVINKKTALEMSKKCFEFFNTEISVSFTGNAGPDLMEKKQQGIVYIAINEDVYEKHFLGQRNEVQKQAVLFAFEKICKKNLIIKHFLSILK